MSLAYGRHLRAIPGPSVMPDRVLNAMHRAAPNIYEGDLIALTDRVKADLKTVAGTNGDVMIYIGNGHAGWEAALNNIVNPGDTLLALETGRFTKGWVDMARRLDANVQTIDFGNQATVDLSKLEDALKADKTHAIKAVMLVQVDTSTSVRNDIPAIRAAMDATNHPALLMVDCIASLGCEEYLMDAWGVDVTVAACQKGLMTPPGVAFNYISDKALDARQKAQHVTSYWDWETRRQPEIYYQNFCGTAPTHHIFGLGEALDMILREEGLKNTWNRHQTFARSIWAAVEAWGANGPMSCNIEDRAIRSHSVTTIRIDGYDTDAMRTWCEQNAGLTLGVGLGFPAPPAAPQCDHFRIGHMGHLNPPMVLGTLATIQAAMIALDIPHGNGALDAAAGVIATNV